MHCWKLLTNIYKFYIYINECNCFLQLLNRWIAKEEPGKIIKGLPFQKLSGAEELTAAYYPNFK
jgi:hypothetical protein